MSKVDRTVRIKGIVSVVKLEQSALHVEHRGGSSVCGARCLIEGFAASILGSTECDVAQCMHHGYSRCKYFML